VEAPGFLPALLDELFGVAGGPFFAKDSLVLFYALTSWSVEGQVDVVHLPQQFG
jgi:hypothetical protein